MTSIPSQVQATATDRPVHKFTLPMGISPTLTLGMACYGYDKLPSSVLINFIAYASGFTEHDVSTHKKSLRQIMKSLEIPSTKDYWHHMMMNDPARTRAYNAIDHVDVRLALMDLKEVTNNYPQLLTRLVGVPALGFIEDFISLLQDNGSRAEDYILDDFNKREYFAASDPYRKAKISELKPKKNG